MHIRSNAVTPKQSATLFRGDIFPKKGASSGVFEYEIVFEPPKCWPYDWKSNRHKVANHVFVVTILYKAFAVVSGPFSLEPTASRLEWVSLNNCWEHKDKQHQLRYRYLFHACSNSFQIVSSRRYKPSSPIPDRKVSAEESLVLASIGSAVSPNPVSPTVSENVEDVGLPSEAFATHEKNAFVLTEAGRLHDPLLTSSPGQSSSTQLRSQYPHTTSAAPSDRMKSIPAQEQHLRVHNRTLTSLVLKSEEAYLTSRKRASKNSRLHGDESSAKSPKLGEEGVRNGMSGDSYTPRTPEEAGVNGLYLEQPAVRTDAVYISDEVESSLSSPRTIAYQTHGGTLQGILDASSGICGDIDEGESEEGKKHSHVAKQVVSSKILVTDSPRNDDVSARIDNLLHHIDVSKLPTVSPHVSGDHASPSAEQVRTLLQGFDSHLIDTKKSRADASALLESPKREAGRMQNEIDARDALLFLRGAVSEAGSRMLYNNLQNGTKLQLGSAVGGVVSAREKSQTDSKNFFKIVTVETSSAETPVHNPVEGVQDSFTEENRIRHLHVDPTLQALVGEVSRGSIN